MIDGELGLEWKMLAVKLGGYVARRVPTADADDVTQEALMRIARGVSELRDDERLGPWVYRVTRSAIADHLRRRSRSRERASTEDQMIDAEAAEVLGEEDDLKPVLTACLPRFIAALPSPYREAITLTELEGLSQKDAASMAGISLSGMKSRVQRGRDQLRTMFEHCCALTQDARGRVIECQPHQDGPTDAAGEPNGAAIPRTGSCGAASGCKPA